MGKDRGTHEYFGGEARCGENSCLMGINFSLKSEAEEMTIKNQGRPWTGMW